MDVKSLGTSLFIGKYQQNLVKVDLWHEEPFIYDEVSIHTIRMASLHEIAAMKCNVIASSPRKKDFWDIHALSDTLTKADIFNSYLERYPYSHDMTQLHRSLSNPAQCDNDLDPISLNELDWEIVKYELIQWHTSRMV